MLARIRSVFRRTGRALAAAAIAIALTVPVVAQDAQPPAGGATAQPPEGFEAVTDVPPSEQLPAAPLVMSAYAFVWVVLLAYIWSVGRRLTKVQEEIDRLDARLKKGV